MNFKNAFWVLFISMVPLIELRGAVPVGAVLDLPFYVNYIVAVIGNILPVPFILLFIPTILNWLERFKLFRPIVQWLHKKADKNRGKIDKAEGGEPDTVSNSDTVTEVKADLKVSADAENVQTAETAQAQTVEVECAQPAERTKSEGAGKAKMSVGTFIALMLFVLIPAPGTGAWTGALVASLFGFSRIKSFAAIALGVLGCGVIMCLASYGVLGFLSFLV